LYDNLKMIKHTIRIKDYRSSDWPFPADIGVDYLINKEASKADPQLVGMVLVDCKKQAEVGDPHTSVS
jgi:hypothetical protein